MRQMWQSLIFSCGLIVGFLTLHILLDPKFAAVRTGDGLRRTHTAANMSSNTISSNATRVLCWIMTGPKNIESRVQHIRQSWAERCSTVLYMSSIETDFPTVGLNVSEGRENLYWKTIRALQYIHQHHLDEADWFLKADDDTFVVVENLIHVLTRYDPEKPLYLGRRFAPFIKQGYMSGGAGYVLSKEALRRFINGFSSGKCTHSSTIEDLALGQCMEKMEVKPADSRDLKGRQTFHPYPPDYYLLRQPPRPRPWYLLYEHYPPVEVSNNKLRMSMCVKPSEVSNFLEKV